MRVAVIEPAAGPRTGSRTYAADIVTLLAEHHEVVRMDPALARPGDGPSPDLLHVLDAKSALGSVRAIEASPLPLVIDLHDDYWTGRPFYPAFDRAARVLRWRRQRPRYLALLRRADAVIVHARHMRETVPHDRVVVVPIPVRPAPEGLEAAPPGDRLRVLFAGRDALRKGLPVLGDALRLLRDRGVATETTVAGGDYPHLRAAARRWLRGLAVEYPGDVPAEDMSRAFARADLLAVPSHTEAFGLVAQEALAHGVPVAASRTGGLEEILGPADPAGDKSAREPGGLLVPPGDAAALAEAMGTIAADRDLWRRRARAAGRALAAVRTREAAAAALLTAYETALAHRRTAR